MLIPRPLSVVSLQATWGVKNKYAHVLPVMSTLRRQTSCNSSLEIFIVWVTLCQVYECAILPIYHECVFACVCVCVWKGTQLTIIMQCVMTILLGRFIHLLVASWWIGCFITRRTRLNTTRCGTVTCNPAKKCIWCSVTVINVLVQVSYATVIFPSSLISVTTG